MNRATPLFVTLLAGAAAFPVEAQEAPSAQNVAQQTTPPPSGAAPTQTAPQDQTSPPVDSNTAESDEENEDEAAIVVTGQRLPGSVIGDIQPEVQLTGREVRAYGASSLAELLDALSPQTQSGRGRGGERPVVLLNGRRISGWQEIRDIPPEAIQRVDILPEEVALKYGYRADQKVVNFVLRRRFRALTTEASYGFATQGGRGNVQGDLNLLRIYRDGRWNFDMKYQRQDALFESDRNILQSAAQQPFDLTGNVGPSGTAAQIDPALSALAGVPVTIAGVPQSAASGRPSLNSFLPGANNPNLTSLARYRTLLPRTTNLSMNGTWNRTIFGNVSATVNGSYEIADSESAIGLPSTSLLLPRTNPFSPFGTDATLYRYIATPRALQSDSSTETAHLGVALNGDMLPWRWSLTGSYDRSFNKSFTARSLDTTSLQARISAGDPALNPFAAIPSAYIIPTPEDRATATSQSADVEAVINGPLFRLPGGNVSTTLKVGGQLSALDSDSIRSGLAQSRHLSRDQANGQINVDIPIASRRAAFLTPVGDLSLNLNMAVDQLSDFGTLTTLGYGFNWRPIPPVSIIGSMTHEEGAPSMGQLGNPTILTPNVRVFDFVRGETVDISRLDGGNPGLRSDNRRAMKLGLTVRPFTDTDLSISANYTNNRIRNPIASFPTATAEIESAFPDRFVRDVSGRLVRIDSRPLNFQSSHREQLRWGLNFSKALGRAPAPPEGGGRFRRFFNEGQGGEPQSGARQPGSGDGSRRSPSDSSGQAAGQGRSAGGGFLGGRGPGGFGGGRGGFGGGRGGFGGGRQARIQLSLYHTWHFRDDVVIRPGIPKLDFLNGSAAGSGGGQPRHEIEAQAGIFKNGFGGRLTANWQSATRVEGGSAGAASGDLRFSSLATVNLRLFADLGLQPVARKVPFLRGARVSLLIDNMFNQRLNVRDAAGGTPISYQPGYLDPLGRSIRISFRKLFF